MKFFYLKWYRHIHHIISALEIWFFIWLYGLSDLLYPNVQNLPFILFLLVLNFYLSDFSLKWSGLKKTVEDEISKIQKEIELYEKEQKAKENQD